MNSFDETTILLFFFKKRLDFILNILNRKGKWEESKATQSQGKSQSLAFAPGPNPDKDGFMFLAISK